MKLLWTFVVLAVLHVSCIDGVEDTPGFFLKVAKNVPRLGKRNFITQGSKNVPRLGRRSGPPTSNQVEELKYYDHVQPFDSKFILDFLSDELFIGEGDLKFISWNDFDKILESDPELKKKLASIARDKEIDELKKLVDRTNDITDSEVYGRPMMYNDPATQKIYQKFVPYSGKNNYRYNNMENEVYYYQNDDAKRTDPKQSS